MKLSCNDAASISTQAEYKEASFKNWLRLKLHLYLCRSCNKYYQDNRKLSDLLKKADIKSCSPQEKEILKQKIQNGNSTPPQKY